VTIPAGQTSRTFTVAVLGDRLAEPNETFAVNLTAATGATIGDGQGIGTILDDEPRVSINDLGKSEGSGKTNTFSFTVSLSAAYDQAVTVNYATAGGTATAGTDFQSKSGSLTFAPGETFRTITVVVNGDKQAESNETFFVNLLGASSNAFILDAQGVGTIFDDDRR
jgi:large repetitive protein